MRKNTTKRDKKSMYMRRGAQDDEMREPMARPLITITIQPRRK